GRRRSGGADRRASVVAQHDPSRRRTTAGTATASAHTPRRTYPFGSEAAPRTGQRGSAPGRDDPEGPGRGGSKARARDPIPARGARTGRDRSRRHAAPHTGRLAPLRARAPQGARGGTASDRVLPARRPEGESELPGNGPPCRRTPRRRSRISRPGHRRGPRDVADPGHVRGRRAPPRLKRSAADDVADRVDAMSDFEARARKVLPPVLGHYTWLSIERGEGSWLVTTDGRRVLDLTCGIAVTAVGHSHPRVVKAVVD